MRARYLTVDVFTDRAFGGNQLAVFPDAGAIPEGLFGAIAREFNYSETAFVTPARDRRHTRRVRIFTPSVELPFAGHPTIGTAHALAALGEIRLEGEWTSIVLEEGVGPVAVDVQARGGAPVFARLSAARLPEVGPPPPPRERLAEILSLDAGDVEAGAFAPEMVSCGVPFLFVPLRDRAAVGRALLRREAWEAHLRGAWADSVFVFSRDPELAGSDVRARMFAPALGVSEDPATGSAAAALAGYLGRRDPRASGTLRWTVEQGFEMGRPSLLHVEADKRDGAVVGARVGGSSVVICEGTLRVPG